jgi:predicted RecB family nuclease
MVTIPESVSSPWHTPHRLSKSKFLAALQCEKRLYLAIHHPELATRPDAAAQAILDMGTEIGVLARKRFPGGVLVDSSYRKGKEALARTAELVADPEVPAIYEAALYFDHVFVRVDILERLIEVDGSTRWRLIEVKASTKAKETHVDDVAIQYYVAREAGLPVVETGLLHVNSHYIYGGGEPDVEQLFTWRDLTSEIQERVAAVPDRLASFQTMLTQPAPPERVPDSHCHSPYECPFWNYCTKNKPPRWIYYLPGGGQLPALLLSQGIETIDHIPADARLSVVQRRVRDNVEWLSDDLAGALDSARYPVHHLDFETFMPPVPRFRDTRPYQVIPMQWSDHVEYADGAIAHHEFLYRHPKDPREDFVTALLAVLGTEGSICVYSGYERAILERLAERFPAFERPLTEVMARLWDLYEVLKAHYYHPAFAGSYSIKTVLPAIVPALGYQDLDLQDGSSAARAYYRMIFQEADWVEQERIAESLSRYCARDTLAMVEIRKVLKTKLRRSADANLPRSRDGGL